MALETYVSLGDTLKLPVLVRNSSKLPINADALPGYRIYGPTGTLMTSGTGTVALLETGTITGATNASPISITSASHGLTTGTRVTISGVLGNTAANGSFSVTVTGANTFTLDSSTGNSAYTSGGTWNTAGYYLLSHSIVSASGYESGKTYTALVSYLISSTSYAELYRFQAL